MILTCYRTRRSMKLSPVPSLTEDKALSTPVLAKTLSSVKMEEASAPLEFTDDHPDMAQYVSLLYRLVSQF